jgi:hypothetical protein
VGPTTLPTPAPEAAKLEQICAADAQVAALFKALADKSSAGRKAGQGARSADEEGGGGVRGGGGGGRSKVSGLSHVQRQRKSEKSYTHTHTHTHSLTRTHEYIILKSQARGEFI